MMKLISVVFLSLVLTGCSSFGKGVVEAFLEKQEEKDTKVCEVFGKSFTGIEPSLVDEDRVSKVLKIHGVGHHVPGHSAEFLEKLAKELNMPVRDSHYKEIRLTHPQFPDKKLGILRVERLLNESETKELLYYELTWSEITAPKKAELEYDTYGESSYRRADLNDVLKKFSNDTSPDPMIYLGSGHDEILMSFTTAFCWMMSANWDDLPENTNKYCNPLSENAIKNLSIDDYSFVSHSLGSRIVIDGMQKIVSRITDEREDGQLSVKEATFIKNFQNKKISIYMLSNQLPLLQMSRDKPEVTGQINEYCDADAIHYKDRTVTKTEIIAFSDPNDILSYSIPRKFAENNFDSRLCIDIKNVSINVVDVIDLFGLGTVASPIGAHISYDSDDRVVALIANGVGNSNTTSLVKEKCKWIRLVN